ncbi:alpha/beta hydrolase [Oxalobacteraceae sp. CFBP 13708]|jgi:non-heme chloroperoxidase|nr:alpha/beta hydrolase [Oxalobacteraceae sp. CFBP 8761]MBD8627235.1 alpha/beta hydrolase [Oxalobacteraceae sp. CFBP 8753]MBD8723907.1 alpha/beta hydrolase [Oxalobacteraceae sp. CFBP 13708]
MSHTINTVTTHDGTIIYFTDWGHGTPVVFSHGWPLNGDAWENQMMFLAEHGYRVIAHDRRGHGRSSKAWHGNDMNTYADDLAALLETLDITGATLVGHSTGGGEVARYIGRHGTSRVAKAVLVGAVTPQMIVSAANPDGVPMSVFDGIRDGVKTDRAQYFLDLAVPFFGFNRPGAKTSDGQLQTFLIQGLQCSLKSAYACIKQFSETDFTEDLKKMTVPTLVVHGDDDQIVPLASTARRAVELLPQGRLSVYEGAGHALPVTHKDQLNAELLAFLRS